MKKQSAPDCRDGRDPAGPHALGMPPTATVGTPLRGPLPAAPASSRTPTATPCNDGDAVILIKDLPLKALPKRSKSGTKSKSHPPGGRRPRNHLQDGRDHRLS